MGKTVVLVGIPTLGSVRTELEQRLSDDYGNSADPRVIVKRMANVSDVAAARNALVFYYFDPNAYSHFCMIDADTEPPPLFLDRMLQVGKPVVSGVSHVWRAKMGATKPEPLLAVWKRRAQADGTDTYDRAELNRSVPVVEEPGLAVGCSCMLVEAWVFPEMRAKLGLPWFQTDYEAETQAKTRSEDIFFCRNLERMGINVSILPGLMCRHYKTVSLSDVEEYGRRMLALGKKESEGQLLS